MSNSQTLQTPLTMRQAQEIAKKTIAAMPGGNEDVIQDADTVEKPFGWVFFYTTKKYIETKNTDDIRPGNGPLVVERLEGATTFLPTSVPPPVAIAEFERRWQQKQQQLRSRP